jgi:CRP/FNR family transcriptional regulator, cyclic AMP receptor protein
MRRKESPPFNLHDSLGPASLKRLTVKYAPGELIFSQGDAAKTVFYIRRGIVKLTVVSENGKEAVIGMLDAGDFVGENRVGGQPLRMMSATAITPCVLVRLGNQLVTELLHTDGAFLDRFIDHLISRKTRVEQDLVAQLIHSCEKRLARILLLLAKGGIEGRTKPVVAKISQETLARMIGSTRSRVSILMNKFKKLGFIHYNGTLQVHSSLLNIVRRD